MASKNSIKTYVKDGYYHIYNRGVEKRTIFQDEQDYKVFLKYLKEYLEPPKPLIQEEVNIYVQDYVQDRIFKAVPRSVKNYNKEIDLVAYCLMPNHIHFLLKQSLETSMTQFIQSLFIRYSMYFNKKYERVGSLFQGKYKAVLIEDDNYLVHLSRYIHINPADLTKNIADWYSSYSDYLRLKKTKWLKPNIVLDLFDEVATNDKENINSYRYFVEKYKNHKKSLEDLAELLLDSN